MNIVRDKTSGGIINLDSSSYEIARKRKLEKQKVKSHEQIINELINRIVILEHKVKTLELNEKELL